MAKNVSSLLKMLLVGAFLLLAVFVVVALAIPFELKYNLVYWMSLLLPVGATLAVLFSVMIAFNAEKKDEFGKKLFITSLISLVLAFAIGIVMLVLNQPSIALKPYIGVIGCVVPLAVIIFLLVATFMMAPKEEEK